MCRKTILPALFVLILGLAQVQAQNSMWNRAAYWDSRYPSAWGGGGEATRDALQAAGYKILNADELKTWMNARIADGALSVVVFCRDVVPNTVAESMSATCTIRKYLDAGGKVVWYSDWPFYYQGSPDGTMVTWGSAGATSILGFNASSGPNDNNEEVVFTNAGIEWGLTQTWTSRRPTSPTITSNLTALATVSSGSAAAWVKHFLPGDSYRGFVRFYDRDGQPDAEDVMRVAEYIVTKAGCISPADGSYHPDTWAALTWTPGAFAASHDVYFGESFNDVDTGAGDTFRVNQVATNYLVGFAGFPYPDGLVLGTTYYWRIDEVEANGTTKYKGDIWSFTVPPKEAYNPVPADGAEAVPLDAKLSWASGFGAKLHTVYFGNDSDTVSNAVGGPLQDAATYSPGPLTLEKVYYWRVDEFDGAATHKGNVWAFSTPGATGNPQPANRATGVSMTAKLSWTPATSATSHQVYFGTDREAVRNATTTSPEYKGSKALGNETLDPGKLTWHTSYYWRIDAVYNTGAVKGLVWSFTTADFLLVDDFESYNDIDPPDPASNRIFDSWIDGFGTTDNGALVGNDMPPYAEQTIVHGGDQSMPYSYDNNLKTSEATLTLVYPRDWTEEGVAKLSLWFRGDRANSAERMYVALNGNAVVYHDDAAVTQKPGWTQWVIDLQAFQGVTLTNVNTITIGFGTKNSPAAGGPGKMYFDDIRLYRPRTAP